jgi:hypothetical protein
MSLLLAVTLAVVQPTCSWDRPGINPYTGGADAAIDHYPGIPDRLRATLKRRIAENQPDDTVDITRDAIRGKYQYDPAIRDMHFGAASMCGTVTRTKWAASRVEPGAVYCIDDHCILVPSICGNISRISRLSPAAAAAASAGTGAAQAASRGANFGPATLHAAAPDAAIAAAPASSPSYDLDGAMHGRHPGLAEAGGRAGMRGRGAADDAEGAGLDGDQQTDPNARAFGVRKLKSVGKTPGGTDEYALEEELEEDALAGALARLMAFFGLEFDTEAAAPVPEQSSWAMMLGGLGLLGTVAARRRRAGRPPATFS